jgi:hypothetical protein
MEDQVADKNAINNAITPAATYCGLPCNLSNVKTSPRGNTGYFTKAKFYVLFTQLQQNSNLLDPKLEYVHKANQNEPRCNKTGNNDVLYHFNQYSSTIKARGHVPYQYQTAQTYKNHCIIVTTGKLRRAWKKILN